MEDPAHTVTPHKLSSTDLSDQKSADVNAKDCAAKTSCINP